VTTGAYGLVRHPMYTGGLMMFLLEPNVTENCAVLRSLVTAYFIWGGLIEENRFLAEFGDEYKEYMKRVPRFNVAYGIVRRLSR
jgi:protein-S-isoprenylcysteine O-methyltransferase Ste14